ncbi:uncharacterized protein LOC132742397 [Ruditapes philippinarum]|uniref:uncharacterized protein LOC132742397 n=1 Tax=Ruditapes philippinarum TaxID=129788 RepID=UPI00295B9314|nr:uncharacterized protein LOC132742397 [Ruditapes philippinarum]XP_060586795.1 uncharacterized protein LOC132742397 [Ruditapes philippinarum]
MKTSLINHIFLAMVFVISLNRQSCIAKAIPYSQGNVEMPATVKVKVVATDKRQRRYINQFPDQLDVDVSTDELHEHFQNLKRNHHVPHIKYVHMMENGAVKKFRFERKETMAYYIDVEHGAAFEVSLASEGSEDFDIYPTSNNCLVQYENLKINDSHQSEEQVNSPVSVMQLFNNSMFPNFLAAF